jgi:hypothetical protein
MDAMLVAEGSFWPNYADQQRGCGIRELKMQCQDSGHLHPIISDSLSAEPPPYMIKGGLPWFWQRIFQYTLS